MKLTTVVRLVARLRMHGAILPFSIYIFKCECGSVLVNHVGRQILPAAFCEE
jgi:hypothetical protein